MSGTDTDSESTVATIQGLPDTERGDVPAATEASAESRPPTENSTDPQQDGATRRASRLSPKARRRLPIALAVLVIAAAVPVGLLSSQAIRLGDIEQNATEALDAAVTSTSQVLSYDSKTLDADLARARAQLSGPFAAQFEETASNAIVPAPANCVLQVYGGTSTVVEQYGLYGQLRLSPIAGVTITGGGRLTWWESNNQVLLPTRGNRTSQQIDGRFTPYAGVVWDATDNLNFYASYADSFSPQAAPSGRRKPDGSGVLPLIGAQFEGGTKLSLMNDKLLLSLAAYQIEQTNRLFNDPDDATVYLQVGKVRARGIEAEIGGQILPGWRINGGYGYTRTKYLEDANTAFEGIPLTPIIPEHMVKFFTNYAPVDGALQGLSLGGGVTWFDGTYGGNPSYINPVNNQRVISTIVRQGSYAVVDLRAGYKLSEQISLSINANNVLDRKYYARIAAAGRGNYYGTPRSVFGTIRFTFE